jgi:hypothetical protein
MYRTSETPHSSEGPLDALENKRSSENQGKSRLHLGRSEPFIHKKDQKRRRNGPKYFYSHLYRGGFFVLMVAHPIQDMSEVSVALKTVGVRMPRLRCGAIAAIRLSLM